MKLKLLAWWKFTNAFEQIIWRLTLVHLLAHTMHPIDGDTSSKSSHTWLSCKLFGVTIKNVQQLEGERKNMKWNVICYLWNCWTCSSLSFGVPLSFAVTHIHVQTFSSQFNTFFKYDAKKRRRSIKRIKECRFFLSTFVSQKPCAIIESHLLI